MPITVPTRSTSRTLVGVAGLCVLALAATTAPVTTATASQDDRRPVDLLSPAPAARATADAEGGERSRAVDVDAAALDAVRTGDRISLALFDDTTVTAAVDRRTEPPGSRRGPAGSSARRAASPASWSAGSPTSTSPPSSTAPTRCAARPRATTSSTRRATRLAATTSSCPSARARPSPTTTVQPRGPRDTAGAAGAPGPMASADAPDTIDIAIVYPAQLVAQMGQPAMEAQFALGITRPTRPSPAPASAPGCGWWARARSPRRSPPTWSPTSGRSAPRATASSTRRRRCARRPTPTWSASGCPAASRAARRAASPTSAARTRSTTRSTPPGRSSTRPPAPPSSARSPTRSGTTSAPTTTPGRPSRRPTGSPTPAATSTWPRRRSR